MVFVAWDGAAAIMGALMVSAAEPGLAARLAAIHSLRDTPEGYLFLSPNPPTHFFREPPTRDPTRPQEGEGVQHPQPTRPPPGGRGITQVLNESMGGAPCRGCPDPMAGLSVGSAAVRMRPGWQVACSLAGDDWDATQRGVASSRRLL